MGKLTTIMAILCGVVLISYFGGILNSSPTLYIMLHLNTILTSTLFLVIAGVIASIVVLGFGTGILTRDSRVLELISYSAITTYLLGEFLWDIINIYTLVIYPLGTGARIFGMIILGPLTIIFIMTVLDWYRGTTT